MDSAADSAGRPIAEWDSTSAAGVGLWAGVGPANNVYGNIVDTGGASHSFSTPGGVLVPNLLQHVALTYDKSSGVGTLYVNGAQAVQSSLGRVYPQTSYDLYLGSRVFSSYRWAGLIDELSLYNRALTSGEVWSVYSAFSQGKTCSTCGCAAPPTGLVSWWRAENNANDSTGGNNGTPQGGVSYVYGEVGSGFYLNGTGPYVYVPGSGSLNVGSGGGFTIEGWIQPSDNNGRPIVEWDSASAYGVGFWANWPSTGKLFANIVDTSGTGHTFSGGPSYIVFGLWHHVALTYDKASGRAYLYLDGSQVAQSTLASFTPQTTYNLYLGARVVSTPTPWFGALDEISLYNRALSAGEIASLFYALGNGKCH